MPAFMRAFLFKSSTKVELSYKVKKSLSEVHTPDRDFVFYLFQICATTKIS